MPVAQLLSAGIEVAFNQLLKLDPDSQVRLTKLAGKSLQVRLKELPWPILFSFSEQIDVQLLSEQQVADSAADCVIELNLETLPKLKDSSQLTQLIQQQQLNLVGDIYVAQTFSSLLKELDIDWEEQLSHYVGDVAAHKSFSTAKAALNSAKQQVSKQEQALAKKLTQADSIAVTADEMRSFSQGVSHLRSATERLAARLALLEKTNNHHNPN